MFTVKSRMYGKTADGRTVLLYTPGMTISDDDAKRAGLLAGTPAPKQPARGLTIETGAHEDDAAEPAKPLARMNLAELRATCETEGIDPGDANLRAEYIDAISAGRAKKARQDAQRPDTGAPASSEGSRPSGPDED